MSNILFIIKEKPNMNIYDVYKNPVGKIYADTTGLDIMSAIVTAVEADSKPKTPQYFYFEAVEAGSTFQINNSYIDCTFEYSTDGKTWTNLGFNTITLENIGDRAYIRQSSDRGYWQASGSDDYKFNTTGNLKIGGYISTLAYNDTSHDRPNMDSTYSMSYIFFDCAAITDASDLKLDFVELTEGCYYQLFAGTSLTTAPELPATELTSYCYENMFFGCSSLTTAPELPATTLATQCYSYMFYGCSSLTTAPELPATTLATYCYQGMFLDCSNLNSITVHATSWKTSDADNWVSGVSEVGTFTCSAGLNIPTGTSGIPEGWTRLE